MEGQVKESLLKELCYRLRIHSVHCFFLVEKSWKLAENDFLVLMAATMYAPVSTLKCEYICMYLLKLEASFKISYTD